MSAIATPTSTSAEVSPRERLEVIFEELAELTGQRNAIDGRIVDLVAEIDTAVKQANLSVSHAESIRKFRILPVDFTEDTGELTPTLKVKRKVVAEKFAAEIAALYS